LPQVNPATIALVAAILLGAAWAAGLVRVGYEEGRATLHVTRAGRVVVMLNVRDTWLLLGLALLMGWAVAAAVERSAWVPDYSTDGRLVPALALTSVLGWLFTCAGLRRFAYGIASLLASVLAIAWFTPSPLTSAGLSAAALRKWSLDLPAQTNLLLLMGLILMFALAGTWTSWWIFRRHNGLVALLPSGTILAVEIINDTSAGLGFFVVVWLAAAASVLLRLNFVALKENWRARRLPHAADTGWTFGEVGIEATVGIIAIAFLILPPLSSSDISGALIPGAVHTDLTHPFGIGSGSGAGAGGIGTIGYSETVQPGRQLKAKSETVMRVSGDGPIYYPYWRGIALAGWDGRQWYPLPSSPQVPVRQQPRVAAGTDIPRDDLPTDSRRIQVQRTIFQVIVPPEQTFSTVFSGGEVLSVNQPITVRGIMTSQPAPPGSVPALVNVAGDSVGPSPFDTVDQVHLASKVRAPYSFSVTEAVPNAAVNELRAAGTDYPAWLAPYISLYGPHTPNVGYRAPQDADIQALAQSIVQAANATTPYDQAKAIESWFNQNGRFKYRLDPPPAPPGVRPLDFFLFDSKQGYCQDFSSAMNVMLRMLGIPSRQVSGYSQGPLDDKTHQYVVNSLDAHSWVEVFFPGYGWIPFEPTPDGVNGPINRPQTRELLNVQGNTGVEPNSRPQKARPEPAPESSGTTAGAAFPDIWRQALLVGGTVLLLLVIGSLLLVRWLLAVKDVPRIWRRLLFLGDRLKIPRHRGDTPQEFGGRLATFVPPFDEEVRRLASLYTRARFRRDGLTADELAEARRVWRRIRGSYAGLVVNAWRDALRRGRVLRAEEGATSENREPSRRR
jgi:hypothetical protein